MKTIIRRILNEEFKQSNLDKVLDMFKPKLPVKYRDDVDAIGDFIKNYIRKTKFNVKFLNFCSTGFAGVRTKDQVIICSPTNMETMGDFIYTIFHEIRHEQQVSKIFMNNPLIGDLDDFEKLFEEYWEMELDADQFAKNMIVTLISELKIPSKIANTQFKLSPYISQYPSLSKSIKNHLMMIVNEIKEIKKSGAEYEDIQDHPIVKKHLDKLEDLI
jgi:hypothetical protein